MTMFLTLAQENLRDLDEEQRQEGQAREAFGGAYSYEDWLGRREAAGEIRRELEEARVQPYRDLIERVKSPTFEDTFQAIFDQAFELLIQRQRKYGPDNIARQGMWGVLTRIADDKIARLRRAFNGRIASGQIALDPVAEGEADDTFEDACLDLMNYAAILLALKRGEWGRPLSAEAEAAARDAC